MTIESLTTIQTTIAPSSHHAFSAAEILFFTKHLNKRLANDPDLATKLPISLQDNSALFKAVEDGVILCKLICSIAPGLIDSSKINVKFTDEKKRLFLQIENQNLMLAAASKLGCNVINLGSMDLIGGKEYLVLGLVWQLIKMDLLAGISVTTCPELLVGLGEDAKTLPPEQILIRWVNFVVRDRGIPVIKNMSVDLQDLSVYTHLMNALYPSSCDLSPLKEASLLKRATIVLKNAEKIGCSPSITPEDIISGNDRLNLVFVAELFHKNTGFEPLPEQLQKQEKENFELKLMIADRDLLIAKLKDENAKLRCEIDEVKFLFDAKASYSDGQLAALTNKLNQLTDDLRKEKTFLETSEFNGQNLALELDRMKSKHASQEYLIEYLKTERQRSDEHVARLRLLYNTYPSTEALCQAIYQSLALDAIILKAAMHGFLTKKARFGNSWKHRYIVLRDNFLFYYKNDKDRKENASGAIRMDDALLQLAENTAFPDVKHPWILCIDISTGAKPLTFFLAGEKLVLEQWKDAIGLASAWWTRQSSMDKIREIGTINRSVSEANSARSQIK